MNLTKRQKEILDFIREYRDRNGISPTQREIRERYPVSPERVHVVRYGVDLAPYVGADLGVMERDARRLRGERPVLFTNLRAGIGVDAVIDWIRHDLLLTPA